MKDTEIARKWGIAKNTYSEKSPMERERIKSLVSIGVNRECEKLAAEIGKAMLHASAKGNYVQLNFLDGGIMIVVNHSHRSIIGKGANQLKETLEYINEYS